jgi:hypothetical protein
MKVFLIYCPFSISLLSKCGVNKYLSYIVSRRMSVFIYEAGDLATREKD